jgi:membrane associated rhomboid family serine protease
VLPLKDNIPSARAPVVNVAIIAACILVFLWELAAGQHGLAALLSAYAFIPREFFSLHAYLTEGLWPAIPLVTSMFLHGGFLHIGVNMLFLWVFGDNVEDEMGPLRYLGFYLLCGVIASLAHAITNPLSALPSVGASGAIAGVMGAYIRLFPGATIRGLVPVLFLLLLADVPAVVFIGFWFVLQLFSGVASIGAATGIAFFAHIGGFLAGLSLVPFFVQRRPGRPRIRRFEILE